MSNEEYLLSVMEQHRDSVLESISQYYETLSKFRNENNLPQPSEDAIATYEKSIEKLMFLMKYLESQIFQIKEML